MAYMKVIIRGTLPGSEVWSCGLAFVSDGMTSAPISQTDMNALATAISAIDVPPSLRTMMSTSAAVIGARVEHRSSGGTLISVGEGARSTPLIGAGQATKPAQCSFVVSLRTPVPGRSGRGRVYWPALGAPMVPTSLRMTMLSVEETIDGFRTYTRAMRTAIDTTLGSGNSVLAVRSERQQTEHWVSVIEGGDVIDTQRRRRDKLVENRVGIIAQ